MNLFKLIGLAFHYRAWAPYIDRAITALTAIVADAVKEGVPDAEKVLAFLQGAQNDDHGLTPEQIQAATDLGEKLQFDRAADSPDTSGGP